MQNFFFLFSVLSVLFVPTVIAPVYGLKETVTYGYLPMMMYALFIFFGGSEILNTSKNRQAKKIIMWSVLFFILKFALGQDYFKSILCLLIIPMCMSMVFEYASATQRRLLLYCVLAFFFIECGISFFEKSTGLPVIPLQGDEYDHWFEIDREGWQIRSRALLGHPLQNAMGVMVITTFILVSKFKLWFRLLCFAVGYISLFCFNARGATLVATFILIPYILRTLHVSNIRKKKTIYMALAVGAAVLVNVLLTTSLGGRIFNEDELMDGSAQTRLDVYDFYKYLSLDGLLFGSPTNYKFLMHKLGAGGVENGVITLIIDYGLIITSIMLPLLISFHYKKLSAYYPSLDKWLVLLVYYVIGTMNPNLTVPTNWVLWIMSYYALRCVPVIYRGGVRVLRTVRDAVINALENGLNTLQLSPCATSHSYCFISKTNGYA